LTHLPNSRYNMQMDASKCKHRISAPGRIAVTVRCVLVIGAEATVGAGLARLAGPGMAELASAVTSGEVVSGRWPLDRLVVDATAWLACLAYVALTASTVAILVAACLTRGAHGHRRLQVAGPLWWRRAVLVACGIGLVAPAVTGAALGTEPAAPCAPRCRHEHPRLVALSGLRLPDLPLSPQPRPPAHVTVRTGESLWLIAEDLLRPSARDAAICRSVDRLYHRNRAGIGADPDLILPGTRLLTSGGNR
jgi:hypothetical protein